MTSPTDLSATASRIEELIAALDAAPDSEPRRQAVTLVRETMSLYGMALARMLELAREKDASLIERFAADDPVALVLALHDLMPPTPPAIPLVRLERGKRRGHAENALCEQCGTSVDADHRHVVNADERRLLCSCQRCWESVSGSGAGSPLRAVPAKGPAHPPLLLSEAHWDALQIPVGLAFFIVNGNSARTFAFYPSPAGPVESLLPLDAWRDLVSANPWMSSLRPDVEALLVRRGAHLRHETQAAVVPIDACYDLIGRIRLSWKGFDGGQAVRSQIDAFFARLVGDDVQLSSAAGR